VAAEDPQILQVARQFMAAERLQQMPTAATAQRILVEVAGVLSIPQAQLLATAAMAVQV
jgi:hypothetical protein